MKAVFFPFLSFFFLFRFLEPQGGTTNREWWYIARELSSQIKMDREKKEEEISMEIFAEKGMEMDLYFLSKKRASPYTATKREQLYRNRQAGRTSAVHPSNRISFFLFFP